MRHVDILATRVLKRLVAIDVEAAVHGRKFKTTPRAEKKQKDEVKEAIADIIGSKHSWAR